MGHNWGTVFKNLLKTQEKCLKMPVLHTFSGLFFPSQGGASPYSSTTGRRYAFAYRRPVALKRGGAICKLIAPPYRKFIRPPKHKNTPQREGVLFTQASMLEGALRLAQGAFGRITVMKIFCIIKKQPFKSAYFEGFNTVSQISFALFKFL